MPEDDSAVGTSVCVVNAMQKTVARGGGPVKSAEKEGFWTENLEANMTKNFLSGQIGEHPQHAVCQ